MRGKKRELRSLSGIIMLLICTLVFSGCGGSDDTPAPVAPSGKVVQGAVSGAKVFADHKTGAEANYKMDADEASTATTTAADGTFTLAAVPGYDYVSVSSGGVDSITGQPAMQMLAPAGVGIISPLTTMVAMDPGTESVIASLGVNYKDDVSKAVTPAVLLFIQSVQTVVATMTAALNTGGSTMKDDQINAIQRAILTQVAAGIKGKTVAQMTSPTTLTTTLQTAVNNALVNIVADTANSNITMTTTTQALANAVVTNTLINTVATAVDSTGTFSTAAADAKPEATIITPADAATINTQSATEAAVADTKVTVTKKPNTPPTISGSPTLNITAGQSYSFTPTAVDADGDSLTFEIANKPAWASFNTATGKLSGVATATASGIVIYVTDGVATVSLPAFTVTVVTGTTGSGGGTI